MNLFCRINILLKIWLGGFCLMIYLYFERVCLVIYPPPFLFLLKKGVAMWSDLPPLGELCLVIYQKYLWSIYLFRIIFSIFSLFFSILSISEYFERVCLTIYLPFLSVYLLLGRGCRLLIWSTSSRRALPCGIQKLFLIYLLGLVFFFNVWPFFTLLFFYFVCLVFLKN